MKNYVRGAVSPAYQKMMYDEACEHISAIHVLIGMAHTETVKAMDMIDDAGLRRHLVKKHLSVYEAHEQAYSHYMFTMMERSAWSLLQDYIASASERAGYRLMMLRQACYNYLKKRGIPRASLLAQCEVALLMWRIEADTFTLFFDSYRQACGVDFRRDFAYADMSRCVFSWQKVVNELAKSARGIDFGDDRRCRESWQMLKEEIDDADFFDGAAGRALSLNAGIEEKYADKLEGLAQV